MRSKNRSSHPEVFCKKGVLRNFAKFIGKHLCQMLFFFNKVAGLRPATLLKKSLWHRCFPVNFAKYLRTPFLQNTSNGCFCKNTTQRRIKKLWLRCLRSLTTWQTETNVYLYCNDFSIVKPKM